MTKKQRLWILVDLLACAGCLWIAILDTIDSIRKLRKPAVTYYVSGWFPDTEEEVNE